MYYHDQRKPKDASITIQNARPTLSNATVLLTTTPQLVFAPNVLPSTESALIDVVSGMPMPLNNEVRLREVLQGRAYGDLAMGKSIGQTVRKNGDTVLEAAVDLKSMLSDSLNGDLEAQVYDLDRRVGSAWVPLPGHFAMAPSISQIRCPAAADVNSCELVGTSLTWIESVVGAPSAYRPVRPCVGFSETTKQCVLVPRLNPPYVLRLSGLPGTVTVPTKFVLNQTMTSVPTPTP